MSERNEFVGAESFLQHYNAWRNIYGRFGKPPRDEPDWQDGGLWLRDGFPNPDWSAFVIERTGNGYDLLQATTERRSDPVTSHQGYFSRFEDAGKYVIAAIGDYLRIDRRLDPVSWTWDDEGVPPGVEEIVSSDSRVTYRLREDHEVYCVMARGDRAYSHLLLLTYEDLGQMLLNGFPEVDR